MRMLGLVASLVLALGCNRSPKSPPGAAQATGTPPATGAAAAAPGSAAPDAQLTDASGGRVAMASVLHRRPETVVVFYRGFW